MSFKQVHDLGGTIRKGEHAHPCFFWQLPQKAKVETDADGNEVEVKKAKHFFLRYYHVFNIAQTEGIPAAKIDKVSAETFKHDPIPEAEAIWRRYAESDGPSMTETGSRAFYAPRLDTINIPDRKFFPQIEEFYTTLFHEAGHSTGHESRLNRQSNMRADFGSEEYGREELIAELCASILCGKCGITRTLENSAAYCANWSKAIREAPAHAVVGAASAAEKAADWILGTNANAGKEAI